MASSPWKYVICALVLFVTGCDDNMNAETPKFDWLATDCAPKNYPMEIIDGTFYYYQQEEGLYIPSGGTLCSGWGTMISIHVVGDDLKPLPDRLRITFFSYLEDAFYEGTFDLPYGKILDMFESGYFSPSEEGQSTYYRIMCGVAPGGTVVVWLIGQDKITEVFAGQAKVVDVDWQKAMETPPASRAEFVKAEIDSFVEPSIRELVKKNGVPVADWSSTFRKRYQWVPTFVVENPPKIITNICYVNGERDYLFYPLEKALTATPRAVPRQLNFVYESPGGWSHTFLIHFDEREMVESFSKLGSTQEPLQLEFEPQYPVGNTQIRLRNQDGVVILNRYTIEKLGK